MAYGKSAIGLLPDRRCCMRGTISLAFLLMLLHFGIGRAAAGAIGLRPIEGDGNGGFASALERGLEKKGFVVIRLSSAESVGETPAQAEGSQSAVVFDLSLSANAPADLGEKAGDLLAEQLTERAGLKATRV